MTEPLLNLDTLIVRPVISIDGKRYEILSADEVSILDGHRFGVWGRRIDALSASDDADDAVELDALYEKVARAVMIDVPPDVFDRLSGSHRIAVVDVFTSLLLRNKLGVAGAMETAMGPEAMAQWTGVRPSRGSSDSMAERRSGGWLKRLRHWFART